MFEQIPLIVALGGSSLAAIYDLKTTEIPDKIPYAMAAIGLIFYIYLSVTTGNFLYLRDSVIVGFVFLGFGFAMYYFGQWGGGDAKVLSAIGFLLPTSQFSFSQTIFPFPLSYFINVFVVGAAYMLIYSFFYSLMNRRVLKYFSKDIKASSRIILLGSFLLFAVVFVLDSYLMNYFGYMSLRSAFFNSFLILVLTIALFIVWKFAKSVEDVGFKKKIPVSKLKIGDILLGFKHLEGATEAQVRKIKKSGKKFVWIKEGVRFAPAFPLALLATVYFGDIIFLIRLLI